MESREQVEDSRADGRRRHRTGLILVLSVQYVICTIITAAAWSSPRYDWGQNYISDLGVRECADIAERFVCSPLHEVMNWSFVAQACIFAAAGIAGLKLVPRYRALIGTLIALTSLGVLLVGLFPGSIEGAVGSALPFHRIGAFVGIIAGNLLLITLGLALRSKRRFAPTVLIALGVVALLSVVWLANWPHAFIGPGLPERLAADIFIVTSAIVGARLLLRPKG